MSSRFSFVGRSVLAGLLVGLGGCNTLSTQLLVTPNPVLLGPVERIGGRASPAPSGAHGVYMQTQAMSGAVSSGDTKTSFSEQPASTAQDFQLHQNLGGDAHAIVRVTQQECSAFVLASLGGVMQAQGCELFGVAYSPPQ